LLQTCPRRLRAKPASGAGLFLIKFNDTNTGGHDLAKHHPGVRCCGRRGGLFCYLPVATGGEAETENNHKESQGRDWPGRIGAVQTRPWLSYLTPPIINIQEMAGYCQFVRKIFS